MQKRDLPKTLSRSRDPAKILRDPRFLRYHSPPLDVERFAFRNRQAQPFFSPYSRQFNGSQRSWQFSQPFASSSTNQHFSTTNREFTLGPCRYCGSSGHWWMECPVHLARFHIGCSSSQLPASSTGTVNRP